MSILRNVHTIQRVKTNASTFSRAQYTRRKFRMVYTKVMKRATNNSFHRNSASFIRYYGTPSLTLSLLETLPTAKELPLFDYPFNELLVSNESQSYRTAYHTAGF